MSTLSYKSTVELLVRRGELERRIAEAGKPPVYPPPGYRPDFVMLKEYEIEVVEINKELARRHTET